MATFKEGDVDQTSCTGRRITFDLPFTETFDHGLILVKLGDRIVNEPTIKIYGVETEGKHGNGFSKDVSWGIWGRLQYNAILYDMYDVPRDLLFVVFLGTSINLHKSIQITESPCVLFLQCKI